MSFWGSLKKISLKKVFGGIETAAKGALGAIGGAQQAAGGQTVVQVQPAAGIDTKTIVLIGVGVLALFFLIKR